MPQGVSNEVARVALVEFRRQIKLNPHPVDLEQRNLQAMRSAIKAADRARNVQTPLLEVSAYQMEVLELLAENKTYKQIAQELDVAVSTIRTHLHNIYKLMGGADRVRATMLVREGRVKAKPDQERYT